MVQVVNRSDLDGIGMTSRRTRERLVQRLVDQGIADPAVLEVMRATPRHLFLDEAMAHRAYEDTALPIGYQQTLSQPYIVARMTELLLAAGPLARVLEIGTGSGYQAAVLAQLPGPDRFTSDLIANANGFAGRDGIFRFLPGGTSERGLAVLQVRQRDAVVIDRAPATFQALSN